MSDKTPEQLLAQAKERGAVLGGNTYFVFTTEEIQTFAALTANPSHALMPTISPQAGRALKECRDCFVTYNGSTSDANELARYVLELQAAWPQPKQPSQDAHLLKALRAAQRAIDSMKQTAETAGAGGDKRMLQEACESISNEGLAAFTAINAVISARGATK